MLQWKNVNANKKETKEQSKQQTDKAENNPAPFTGKNQGKKKRGRKSKKQKSQQDTLKIELVNNSNTNQTGAFNTKNFNNLATGINL